MKRPERIVWRDAYALDETWIAEGHTFGGPVIVTTVGYVIKGHGLGKGYVVVADSSYRVAGQRWYGGVTVIPAGMVVERRRL